MSDSTRTFPVPLPEGFDIDELMTLVPADMWEKDEKAAAVLALRRSGKFDEEWYLNRYPDVRNSGMDAVEHYIRYGFLEGRLCSQKREKKIELSSVKENLLLNKNVNYNEQDIIILKTKLKEVRISALKEKKKKDSEISILKQEINRLSSFNLEYERKIKRLTDEIKLISLRFINI